MGKRKSGFCIVFIVTFCFQMIAMPYYFSAAEPESIDTSPLSRIAPVDYLALGDSLVAGVNSDNELGKGYADFLAESIHSISALESYNKGFAIPGYSTDDVLRDIQDDVIKGANGIGYEEVAVGLRESIADAEIITISVGANDVLPFVKRDPATGSTKLDQQVMKIAFQKVAQNYNAILKQIDQINPDAKVYVMGYYNPFPYMSEEVQPIFKLLLDSLNKSIVAGVEGTGAIFVPTVEVIASDFETYVPNTKNIHLSEAGYLKVAEQFWNALQASYPWTQDDNFTTEKKTNSLPFTTFTDIENHGLKLYIEQATKMIDNFISNLNQSE